MKNRKNRTLNKTAEQPRKQVTGISKRGKKVIAAGIAVVLLGYLVLSRTDPMGQNWASVLSPFLLLGGYAMIGIGIVIPSPERS